MYEKVVDDVTLKYGKFSLISTIGIILTCISIMHVRVLINITLIFIFVCVSTASEGCETYFKELTDVAGEVLTCFGKYSQPVALCGQCKASYSTFQQKMNDRGPESMYGIPCQSFIQTEGDLEVSYL